MRSAPPYQESLAPPDGRVVPGGACANALRVGGGVAGAETYAAGRITTDATVLPTGRLDLKAGEEIRPAPGFEVQRGGYLRAETVGCPPPAVGQWQFEYYLTDHLGNNRVLFADVDGDGNVDDRDVLQENHYYPFGMTMEGDWSEVAEGTGNRYGFNGKEVDSDGEWGTSADGSSQTVYDYGFRIYNPQLARFLSVDPLASSYPWYTPYQYAGNKPIWAIDLDGLEEVTIKIDIGITTVHEDSWTDVLPFSHRWNYKYYVDPITATLSDVEVIQDRDLSYNIIMKVPSRAQLSGTTYVPTRYKTFVFESSDLSGVGDTDNWRELPSASNAFREGAEAGFLTGLGEGMLDEAIATAGLRGLSRLVGYSPRLFRQFQKAHGLVQSAVLKIAAKKPQLLVNIEKNLYRQDGSVKAEFDIETDRHVIEVASGRGTGKEDQIFNRLIPNAGGKEVILLGTKKLSGSLERKLREAGVKVFKDVDKMVNYITKE